MATEKEVETELLETLLAVQEMFQVADLPPDVTVCDVEHLPRWYRRLLTQEGNCEKSI